MPGPTTKNNPWADELKKSRRKSSTKGISEGEWDEGDDDGEWEWEADAEAQSEMESNSNKQLAPPPLSKQSEKISNGNTNLINGNMESGNTNGDIASVLNGNHSNEGCTAPIKKISNGHIINIEDTEIEEATGKANIQIEGGILKITRTGPVDWSDDEYEDDEEEVKVPIPPPPPPPAPPPPPPPPPPSEMGDVQARKLKRMEELKKKPTVKPDWNALLKDIDGFRYGVHGKLKKTQCSDRSKPMLSKKKVQGKFIYDSEQKAAEIDIFHDIRKGISLKRVKTNDRSRPVLQGIRCFRRQTTKEDRLRKGSTIEETLMEEEAMEDDEDVEAMREDLESTKQLLDLEVRSKKLLEKDNKRLAQELEKLKMEMCKGTGTNIGDDPKDDKEANASRRNSVATKRHSVIRLLSASESHENLHEKMNLEAENYGNGEVINENDEDMGTTPTSTTAPWAAAATPWATASDTDIVDEHHVQTDSEFFAAAVAATVSTPKPAESFYEEEIAEIDEMREEVDEARKLAEEWEAKYKEMQRQMSDVESSRYRIHSLIIDNVPMNQKKATSEFEDGDAADYDDGDYTWMLKREIRSLNNKLRNVRDKREIVMRERQLLQERIETLVGSIGNEVESRKALRKEINEMNEAFKIEIRDMVAGQKTADDLEDCYFSDDEDLVVNTHKQDLDLEDWETNDIEVDESEDNVNEILMLADEEEYYNDDGDAGAALFDDYPESDEEDFDENQVQEEDYEPTRECINKRVERHHDNVQLMRRSNFLLKAKIDRLYDILQMQKEKHHDLRQELTRMLADIQ